MPEDTKQMNVQLPVDMYRKVRHAAIDRGVTASELIRQAIAAYLVEATDTPNAAEPEPEAST
jgi:metal-responsive CopG/Arc/MetJ family transcriptional regulator